MLEITQQLWEQSCRWQDIYFPKAALHEWMSHPKEMVIFFAILFTEKALLNFCYSVIYYLVAERAGFLHSSPHQ